MKKLLLALALLVAVPAAAQSPVIQSKASPRWGSFQIQLGTYSPDIDSEFTNLGTSPGPYALIFGTGRPLMVSGQFNISAWITEFGTLDVGMGVGFWQAWGQGIYQSTGGTYVRGGSTSLMIIPVQIQASYRWEWFFERFNVPFEPYVRGAIIDDIWSTSGQNGVSSYTNADGTFRGSGATFGWSATIGIGLVLDFFDTGLSRQMDYDVGINRTLLIFDFTRSSVNNFGSSKSWQLAPGYWAWNVGLQFVF